MIMRMDVLVATWIASGGLLHFLYGDNIESVNMLLMAMLLDFISGVVVAMLSKSKKSASGKLSSAELSKGFFKKILILGVIAATRIVDNVLNSNWIYNGAIVAFTLNECLSICENYAMACENPPPFLENVLDILKREESNYGKRN